MFLFHLKQMRPNNKKVHSSRIVEQKNPFLVQLKKILQKSLFFLSFLSESLIDNKIGRDIKLKNFVSTSSRHLDPIILAHFDPVGSIQQSSTLLVKKLMKLGLVNYS